MKICFSNVIQDVSMCMIFFLFDKNEKKMKICFSNVIQDVRSLSRVYRNGGFCHLIGPVTGLSAVSKYT